MKWFDVEDLDAEYVAEYQKGPPTLGAAKESAMQILWCKDGSAGEFAPGSGAPCRKCGAPAWMHWTVRP